jgi:hypothetical protein
MIYKKIRVTSDIAPTRFDRVMYVKVDISLYSLGVLILTSLQAKFEHMFLFHSGRFIDYVDETRLDDPFGTVKQYDYKKIKLCNVVLNSQGNFALEYDTGDGWEFKIHVYEQETVLEDDKLAIVLKGKGQSLREDNIEAFEKYINNEPLEDYEKSPWSLMGDPLSSFDEPLNIEDQNAILCFTSEQQIEEMMNIE